MKQVSKKIISVLMISYLIFSISFSNVLAINENEEILQENINENNIEDEKNTDNGIEENIKEENAFNKDIEIQNKKTIKISSSKKVINEGEKLVLLAKVENQNKEDKIIWSSSNISVAKVDQKGCVTGVKEGKAIIKAKIETSYDQIELTVKSKKTDITLSEKNISIYKGKTKKINVIYSDSERKEKIDWSSSNKKVAIVDSHGLVTGISKGTTTITAKSQSGKTAKCKVTVNEIKSTNISLGFKHTGKSTIKTYLRKTASLNSKKVVLLPKGGKINIRSVGSVWSKVTYTKGKKTYTGYMKKRYITIYANKNVIEDDEYTLKTKLSPSNATDKIKYSSSDKEIAKVDSTGKIIGVSPGIATITAKTESGKTDYATIRIVKKIKTEKIIISPSKYTKIGAKITISKAIYPTNANDTFTWSSNNTKIAKVDSNGVVTPIAIGKATITVKAKSGKSAKCTVYITNKSVLSLNYKAGYIADQYENVKRIEYGKSCLGNPLEAYEIIGNQVPTKTIFMDCAVHGYEDEYAKDGKVLVGLGNALVEYYANNPEKLKNYRIVIVPCANPDGTISGKNNWRAEIKGAFGRCTYKGIDMNRDFKKGQFKAIESVKLRDLMLNYKKDMKFYFNMHGWENSVIGDKDIVSAFRKKVGITTDNSGMYGGTKGYIIKWVSDNIKAKSALVEYKNSKAVNYTKVEEAINYLINRF